MIQWWDSLDLLLKILYCIAIPTTLLLVIQTVLSLLGGFDSGPGIEFSDTSGIDMGGSDIGDMADFPDSGDIAGAGGNADANHMMGDGGNPMDASLFRLFTLQTMVAFLTVFCWSSIVSIQSGTPPGIGILVGILMGLVAMFAVAKLVQVSRRLTESGTINLKNAIGENAVVYIPIPEKAKGEGKVTMTVQGRYGEYSAVSLGERLNTGSVVQIVDVRNGVLVVEPDVYE